VLHEPGWSAGGGHGNEIQVQDVLQPLCVQYGAQFVIAGHNHYYARAETQRVEHITTGGGGAPLHDPDSTFQYIVKVDKSHHFCKLEISTDTLHFTAIRDDGQIIEEFDYFRYFSWTGAMDSIWTNNSNWDMDQLPSSYSDVVIPFGVPHYPEISDTVSCNRIDIRAGAIINIKSPGLLIVEDK